MDVGPPVQLASRPHVHVVDDEELLVELAQRALRRRYLVTTSVDPRAALERLLGHDAIDLVVSDVMMSPLTGLELHHRVVTQRPGLAGRFLFMTGGATNETTKRYLDALPPPMLLLKPFSSLDLESAVAAALAACGVCSRSGY